MTSTNISFREFTNCLRKHYLHWMVPTVILTVASIVYTMFKSETWQATQSMIVRDEVGGDLNPKGRFDSAEALKTAQETILEIARSKSVVQLALESAGPPSNRPAGKAWPLEEDVENAQLLVSVQAPNGSEFGQTEVIHLSVKASSRERATELASGLFTQLKKSLQQLRDAKARSITTELKKAMKLAQDDLNSSTRKLQQLESQVGTDLAELRILSNSAGGDSNLRSTLNEITAELRQQRQTHETLLQAHQHFVAAIDNPDRVIAIPAQFLEAQPALSRLKDGLVDAQLATSNLLGRLSKGHPLVRAAMASEQEVRKDLRNELEFAVEGLVAELRVSEALVQSLERQEKNINSRLDRLAILRAPYSNLVDEVAQQTIIAQQAQKDLADARASLGAAQSTSLITLLDGPTAGNHPLGPGKSTIMLCGLIAGLLTGLGLVFLKSPLNQFRGRRLSDWFPSRRSSDNTTNGRRPTDRPGGRRGEDPSKVRKPAEGQKSAPATPLTSDDQRTNDDRRQSERRSARTSEESTERTRKPTDYEQSR